MFIKVMSSFHQFYVALQFYFGFKYVSREYPQCTVECLYADCVVMIKTIVLLTETRHASGEFFLSSPACTTAQCPSTAICLRLPFLSPSYLFPSFCPCSFPFICLCQAMYL